MMAKIVTHTKARSFEISKLKNLESLLRSLEFVIQRNLEYDAITVANLVRNWSISTHISYSCRNVANWGTSNLLLLILNKNQMDYQNNSIYKIKRKETIHILFFKTLNLSAKMYKSWINQFIIASADSYCNFHIFFMYYVLYFPLRTSTL